MARFEIVRHTRYQEIVVEDELTMEMFREIMGALIRAERFPELHALWVFGPGALPPAFRHFDGMVGLLEKIYARRPLDKRVALAVPGPFVRSVAELFLVQAARLPVQLKIFGSVDDARDWVEG
ncbi:MAG: hypothetical protein IH621_14225 [Krumholzibacteria bacterium]|nr:hypothetical protein [Candidatus Krumholzibacteria bacterium]